MKTFSLFKSFLFAASLGLAVSGATAAEAPDPANDPNILPGVRAFLEKPNSSGGKPIPEMTPEAARQVLVKAQESVQVDLSGVDKSEKTIQVDGADVKLSIVKPKGANGDLPVFMFFHGGGWVLGDFPTHERFVRDLVVHSGAAAVFVNYTPSPEAKFPVANNQAYAATKWVAENGAQIGVDGKRLAVAGNSVGGNMSAVVSLMAKEKGGPKIRFQLLFWPVTDASLDTESYQQFANKRFLTRDMMKWFWDNYTKDPAERKSIHASPLRASVEQLKGLPPALVMTAENDVLRDEGETYARKLAEANVPVTAVRYLGAIHDFGLLNAVATVPTVQAAMRQAGTELKFHLK